MPDLTTTPEDPMTLLDITESEIRSLMNHPQFTPTPPAGTRSLGEELLEIIAALRAGAEWLAARDAVLACDEVLGRNGHALPIVKDRDAKCEAFRACLQRLEDGKGNET